MYEIAFENDNKYTGEYGPVTFVEGKVTTDNSWIASWFRGRGGFDVTSADEESEGDNDQVPEQKEDLNSLTVEQLKAIAKEKGIEGISKLKKEELIEALEGGE